MKDKPSLAGGDSLPAALFLALLVVIVVAFQSLNPAFLSMNNVYAMLNKISMISIAAVGLTFVIIAGKCDMSFHLNACCCGMFMAFLIADHRIPAPVTVALGLLLGGLWGWFTGFAVSRFKFPDVITSIAVGSIGFGAAYFFHDGAYIYLLGENDLIMTSTRIAGAPLPIFIMLIVVVSSYLVLEKTAIGRKFYAVGANMKASYLSGVNVGAFIAAAFVICGAFASLTAMLLTSEQGYGNVSVTQAILMQCFCATYMGWSIFKKPCVHGTFLGAVFISVISIGFASINISYYWSNFVISVLLVIALFISKSRVRIRTEDAPRIGSVPANSKGAEV
jgi:ribose/xylose/arabinose/galactoside ABC-type transport system permease subunit